MSQPESRLFQEGLYAPLDPAGISLRCSVIALEGPKGWRPSDDWKDAAGQDKGELGLGKLALRTAVSHRLGLPSPSPLHLPRGILSVSVLPFAPQKRHQIGNVEIVHMDVCGGEGEKQGIKTWRRSKRQKITSVSEDVKKRELSCTVAGM